MNYNSENRRLIAKRALNEARKGDFEALERTLRYLTNPHDLMNAAAADCAREGDFEFLILQLRMAEASPEVMALAADIIEGKVKRARGKPKESERTYAQSLDAVLRVRKLERQGWGKRTAAVAQVAEEFGMSKTAVQNALARWDEPTLLMYEQAHEQLAADRRRMREMVKRAAATSK